MYTEYITVWREVWGPPFEISFPSNLQVQDSCFQPLNITNDTLKHWKVLIVRWTRDTLELDQLYKQTETKMQFLVKISSNK